MNPQIVHVDGTVCPHTGTPAATLPQQPRCAAGVPVDRVRMPDGTEVPIADVARQMEIVARKFAQAFTPVMSAYARLAAAWVDEVLMPAFRLASQIAQIIEDARAAEAASARPMMIRVTTHGGQLHVHPGRAYLFDDDGSLTVWSAPGMDPDTVVASYRPGQIADFDVRASEPEPVREPALDPCGGGPITIAGDDHVEHGGGPDTH